MARKYTVVTSKILAEIRRLNAAGVSDKMIGIELGICEQSVRRNRLAIGLPSSLEIKKQLAAKRKAEWDAKQMHRNDASHAKQKKKPPEIKLVDEHCTGCHYLVDMHYDNVKSVCYYNVMNDKKRPCKAGSGCTVKDTSKNRSKSIDIW